MEPMLWFGWFRADIIVEDIVLIEVKSVERIAVVHRKQVLTYLRLSGIHLGLLVNYGATLGQEGFERIVDGLVTQKSAR